MVSEPLLWYFLSSLVFISVTSFFNNASAITTAVAASRRWTTDVIQPSSLGSRPAAAVVKEFHTAQNTALCITTVNIAPITFLKVPQRSSCADLHICGNLDAIGDCTRHSKLLFRWSCATRAPTRRSFFSRASTRRHAPPRVVTRPHVPHAHQQYRWHHCWRQH